MLSPKKGILCNLNHIHLQHVSLGIHLALRPEVQEGPITRAPMEADDQPIGCKDCQEMGSITLEVDANSNNPSLQCKCCKSHPQRKPSPVNNQLILEEMSYLAAEEATSPSDPALSPISISSSISSCSDCTLDYTPISVYSKNFPLDDSQTFQGQPEIVPLEDNSTDATCVPTQLIFVNNSSDGEDSNLLNQGQWQSAALEQQVQDTLENLHNGSSVLDAKTSSMHKDAPETPDDPAVTSNWKQLDSNCNALPPQGIQYTVPLVPVAPEHLGLTQNTTIQPNAIFAPSAFKVRLPMDGGAPDLLDSKDEVGRHTEGEDFHNGTVEPRIKDHRPLFVHVTKEPGTSDTNKKTITSFHELAQKRKRGAAGSMSQQAKKDRSDWLIDFSPDTELPPANDFTLSSWCQQSQELQPQQPDQSFGQKEVTTFKELKYRNSVSRQSQIKPEEDNHQSQAQQLKQAGVACLQVDYKLGNPLKAKGLQAPNKAPQPSTDLAGAPRRKMSRSDLQPIAEGLWGEAEEVVPPGEDFWMKQKPPAWRSMVPSSGHWMRGKADGVDRHGKEARRSLSLPGALGTHSLWMANRDGGSTSVLEHKKGLLLAVSFSVDRIISHFSSTRNLVQKAQLGDSKLTPEVGHLLLNTLCPALYALVGDGLKPFQSDVIMGRRRTSPWSVVEASVKPGLSTRCLHYLYSRICNLPQLNSSKKKFNAFLFGLLNVKQLEFWISHLQKQSGLLSVFYTSDGFLALREASFEHLIEELLLLLQPLSVLSFHLDLLFEHRHLHVDVGHLSCTLGTLPCQVQFPVLTDGLSGDRLQNQQEEKGIQVAAKSHTSEPGSSQEDRTVDNDESGNAAQDVLVNPGLACKEQHMKQAPGAQLFHRHQSSASLQQTYRQVLQWGDKLAHILAGNEGPPDGPAQALAMLKCSQTVTQQNREPGHASGPMSWWEQLSQASRIYSSTNKENLPLTKLHRATDPRAVTTTVRHSKQTSEEPSEEKAAKEAQSKEQEAGEDVPQRHRDSPDLLPENRREELDAQQDKQGIHQLAEDIRAAGYTGLSMNHFTSGTPKSHNEGSHGTSIQRLYGEESHRINAPKAHNEGRHGTVTEKPHSEGNHETEAQKPHSEGNHETEAQKLHSVGSHRTDPQDSLDKEMHGRDCSPKEADIYSGGKGLWLGRLFGAHCSPTKGSPTESEINAVKSRRPSRWLASSFSVLDLVRKSSPPEKAPESPPPQDGLKPQRTVRALCDHAGSEQSHLSFQKGDILQVVSTVDEDWICCNNGSNMGLVPVGYTSLIL